MLINHTRRIKIQNKANHAIIFSGAEHESCDNRRSCGRRDCGSEA